MGVNTREPFVHEALGLPGKPFEDALQYDPTPPWALRQTLRRLDIDPAQYTFVDIGCGRGRSLFIAAKLGFRRVVGVELSAELHAAVQRNIETYRGPAATFILHCTDAAEFEPPDGPLVLFLYNPFGARTMGRVASNLDRSLQRSPRPAFVIYSRALYRHHFEMLPTLTTRQDGLDWAIYASR